MNCCRSTVKIAPIWHAIAGADLFSASIRLAIRFGLTWISYLAPKVSLTLVLTGCPFAGGLC